MAAVLTCGEGAVLSHESATALWGIRPLRRVELKDTQHNSIPVTSPTCTLIDLAARLSGAPLDLTLVVETDGGRFHRTPTQQRNDRRRDHAHVAAGLTPLRFTHGQVKYEADYVAATLRHLQWPV